MSTQSVASAELVLASATERSQCLITPRGAAAIYVACRIIGEQTGFGEVVIPAIGCLSIPQAVALAGHRPVFTDVDRVTGCMCPEDLLRRLTADTKAVLPVHIFGHAAEMVRISAITESRQIAVIEDACHGLGGVANGRKIGSWGMFSVASFGATKTLGGLGGGALLFDDPRLLPDVERHISALDAPPAPHALELLALSHRNLYHGVVDARRAGVPNCQSLTVAHVTTVYRPLLASCIAVSNAALHAIVESVEHLEQINAERLRAAAAYDDMLSGSPCHRVPFRMWAHSGSPWRYTFTCPTAAAAQSLTAAFRRAGVHASNHYWSLAEIWAGSTALPGATYFQQRVVNLWVDATATPEYLERSAVVIRDWTMSL